MASNPFRKPVAKSGIVLKARLWLARPDGKDSSQGDLRLIGDSEYLWFGQDLSVPLAWVADVSEVGPGFGIVWEDRTAGETEGAVFCVRTMFGYNKKKRDALVDQIRSLVAGARESGAPSEAVQAEIVPQCEKCGISEASVVDFEWTTNVLLYWIRKPDRRILCSEHASARFRSNFFFNAAFGTLGLPGLFLTPFLLFMSGRIALHRGYLSSFAFAAGLAMSIFPAVVLVAMIVFLLISA